MIVDLAEKARARRVAALSQMNSRRVRRTAASGLKLFPALDNEEIGALFTSSHHHFNQNIFSV